MLIYAAVRPLSPLLTRWFPTVATTTGHIGRAMITVARNDYPNHILESIDINAAGTTRA